MHRYIARTNINRYFGLLNAAELAPERRATVTKLLIAGEAGRDYCY